MHLPMYLLQCIRDTFTLYIMSCDWRDDQIRMLQGIRSERMGFSSINGFKSSIFFFP